MPCHIQIIDSLEDIHQEIDATAHNRVELEDLAVDNFDEVQAHIREGHDELLEVIVLDVDSLKGLHDQVIALVHQLQTHILVELDILVIALVHQMQKAQAHILKELERQCHSLEDLEHHSIHGRNERPSKERAETTLLQLPNTITRIRLTQSVLTCQTK